MADDSHQNVATDNSAPRSFLALAAKPLAAATLILCVLVGATLFARLHWVLELTTHFAGYYFVASLLGAFGWWFAGRPRWSLACAVAAGISVVAIAPLYFPIARTPASDARLRVMTINVLTANRDYDAVLELIETQQPDIVSLVEVDPGWIEALAPVRASYSQHHEVTRADNFGVAVYVRAGEASFRSQLLGATPDFEGVPIIVAKASWDATPLTYVAAHPLPPVSFTYASARNRALVELAELSSARSNRLIIAGDLNITPFSPYFADLLYEGELRDSGVGFGYQPTWWGAGGLVGIAIDHVLHDGSLVAVDRRIGPAVGSDHRPVIVDFAIRPLD